MNREQFLRPACGMTIHDSDDWLRVNCGRCGKPLILLVEDLHDKRTIDCADCEKALPVRERTSHSGDGLGVPARVHLETE